jgi:hypothetical protein
MGASPDHTPASASKPLAARVIVAGLVLLVIGVIIGFGGAELVTQNAKLEAHTARIPTSQTKPADFRAKLASLATARVDLAANAMRAAVDGQSVASAATKALKQNSHQLASSLGSKFTSSTRQQLEQGWQQQADALLSYAVASDTDKSDTRQENVQSLQQFANSQASLLSHASKQFSETRLHQSLTTQNQTLRKMLDEHLAKHYDKEYQLRGSAISQATNFSKMLSRAIVKQFPAQFR